MSILFQLLPPYLKSYSACISRLYATSGSTSTSGNPCVPCPLLTPGAPVIRSSLVYGQQGSQAFQLLPPHLTALSFKLLREFFPLFFTKKGSSHYPPKNRLKPIQKKKILSAFGVRFFSPEFLGQIAAST